MGINLRIAQMFHSVLNDRGSGGNAVDLGSQDLFGDWSEFERVLGLHFSKEQRGLFEDERVSARVLYDCLGFKYYSAIDLDGAHGAMAYDLNLPLSDWNGSVGIFDFVYNGGTTEHCFNQYQVFKHAHDLCATGGIMFHVVPIHGGLNHGFINYHPLVFSALASANGYMVLDAWAYDTSGAGRVGKWWDYRSKFIEELVLDVKDPTCAVMLAIAFEKTRDRPFLIPYQTEAHTDKSQWDHFSDGLKKRFLVSRIGGGVDEVAVFGCGQAARAARAIIEKCGYRVVCHLCDVARGSVDGIPIVDRNRFSEEFFDAAKVLVVGPRQKDDFKTGLPSNLFVVDLNDIYI